MGSGRGHSPSPGAGKPLVQRGGAQAPRCGPGGFFLSEVKVRGGGLLPGGRQELWRKEGFESCFRLRGVQEPT